MTIYFYTPGEAWGFLSNFSAHGASVDGDYHPTVEHYFQSAKFITTDPAHARMIRRVASPKDAARLGRDRSHPLRPDWEAVKEEIMLRGLRAKFTAHASLREQLLATGDEPLVEASPGDFYWGAGQDGSGRNRLGHLLETVREELRAPK
jgi:ribA/ribD-fused uncharacterized protein